MQKIVVRYVSGISDTATSFQKWMHRKYNGKMGYVRRNIDFERGNHTIEFSGEVSRLPPRGFSTAATYNLDVE